MIVCDALFAGRDRRAVRRPRRGRLVGGRAVPALGAGGVTGTLEMRDRFEAAPGRFVTVYAVR